MKKIALVLVLISALVNCTNEANHLIEGSIETLGLEANQTVYVYEVNEKFLSPVDSSKVDKNGEFSMAIKGPRNGVFLFGISMVNTIPIVLNDKSKKIELSISNSQQLSMDYQVKGSEESEQISLFYKEVYSMMKINQDLSIKSKQIGAGNLAGQQVLQQELMDASAKFLEFRGDYIERNKGSEALLVVIDQIRPETEHELLKEVIVDLNKTMPNSPYVVNLNNNIKKMEQDKLSQMKMETGLSVGSLAPDLDFPNPKGENIKLSSLRGKVVLLDFWASWCGPCRKENPNVVNIYNKYKNKGFEIFSFSLDKNKEKWLKAIQEDGLVWKNHSSDLLGWNSASVGIYGFNGIPFTVLIDREGKIIAKKLRGNDLEEAIKKAL